MPQHKSAVKRMRTNEKRSLANRHAQSQIRTLTKKMGSVTSRTEGQAVLRELVSALDKGARKKLLHPNKVARRKSRAQKRVNKLSG